MQRKISMFVASPGDGLVCLREGHYPPGWHSPVHRHRFGQLLLVRDGQVEIALADTRASLAMGALVAIPAGWQHEWWSTGRRDLRFFDISVETDMAGGTFWLPLQQQLARRSLLLLPDAAELLPLAERTEETITADRPGGALRLQGLLLQMLGVVQERFSRADDQQQDDPVRLVEAEIAARYTDPLSLDQMAGWAGVSGKHLCRLFRQAGRPSPVSQVNSRRLAMACELLAETTLPIKRIATRCGYADPQYFSRVFKQAYACSPRSYRQELSGE